MVVVKHPVDYLVLGKFRKKVRTGFVDDKDIAIQTINLEKHIPWQINSGIFSEFLDNLWYLGINQLVGLELYANYEELRLTWLFARQTLKRLFSKEFIGQLTSSFSVMSVDKYIDNLPRINLPTKYKEFHIANDFVFPLKELQGVNWLDNILDYLFALEKGDHIIMQILFRPFPNIWNDYAKYYIDRLLRRRTPTNFVRFMYQRGPITGLLRYLIRKEKNQFDSPQFFKNSIELIKQRMNESLFQTIIRFRLQSVYAERLEVLDKWSTKIMQTFDNTPFNALIAVQHKDINNEFEGRILPPARFNLLSSKELAQFLVYTDKDRSHITKPVSIEVNTSLLSLPIDKGITLGEVSVNGIKHRVGILPEDKRRNLVIFSDTNKYLLHILTNLITGEFNFGLNPLVVVIGDSHYGIFKALAHVLKKVYPNSPFIPLGPRFRFAPFSLQDPLAEVSSGDYVFDVACAKNYNVMHNILLQYTRVYNLPLLNELLYTILNLLCRGVPLQTTIGLLLKPERYLEQVKSYLVEGTVSYFRDKYMQHVFKDVDLKAEVLERVVSPLMQLAQSSWFADSLISNSVVNFKKFFEKPQLLFIDVNRIDDIRQVQLSISLLVMYLHNLYSLYKRASAQSVFSSNVSSNGNIQTLSMYILTDIGAYTSILTARPFNLTLFKAWKDITPQTNKLFSRLNNRIYMPIPFAQKVLLDERLVMPPALKKQVLSLTSGYALFDLVYKNRRVTPFVAAVVKSIYVV